MGRLSNDYRYDARDSFSPLGNSGAMRQLRELISQVAQHDTLVLVQGESGTGKEVVARSVHLASKRADKPFIPVNCGAIPPDLLESELFGHEKGAFTGAIAARKGRFEMAEGGTLFLDEIGDMSLPMQVKLLRVLQERCFERVGSNQTIHCDVRIVAATHRDLEAMIADGSFRHDLYFRLNVFPIVVPPLRTHAEDLPQLLQHFLDKQSERGIPEVALSDGALAALRQYGWPGNIRELENLLERLAITHGENLVKVQDLPPHYRPDGMPDEEDEAAASAAEPARARQGDGAAVLPDDGFDLKAHLTALEKTYIAEALRRGNGTITQAAKLLGLQRTTLAEKMKKLGMQPRH